MKIQASLIMTNKFHVVIIISLLLVSCSKHALDEEVAKSLACGGCVQNKRFLENHASFIMDEANIHNYNTYRELEAKGFLKMSPVSETEYETDYDIEWLAPIYEYVEDSMLSDDNTYYELIVRTFDYDEVEILGSILHNEVAEPYYEIDFVIYGIKPNPLSGLKHGFDQLNRKAEHRKCYVKETKQGGWRVDYQNSFD